MKITAVICSLNRPTVLHDTVQSILAQDIHACEILIASPGRQHILPHTLSLPTVRYVEAPLGLTAQRNASLAQIVSDTDIVAFFDDDMELCSTFLSEITRLFEEHPHIIVASGILLYDGGGGATIPRHEAKRLCLGHKTVSEAGVTRYVPRHFGYGCNMICRYSVAKGARFDERLPLYGWQEDADFSHRITHPGQGPVTCLSAAAVHIGLRDGRISGLRFGFSQIVNPFYLWLHKRTFRLSYLIINLWARCLVGNILGWIAQDPDCDRLGLLRGNVLGALHLLSGKCEPEHIIKLQ